MEIHSQLLQLVKLSPSRWQLLLWGESLSLFGFRVFWVMNIACLIMTVSKQMDASDFIRPSASLATFLSWFYLLLFLQRYALPQKML